MNNFQRWWEFERRVMKDAIQTSRDTFREVRNLIIVVFVGLFAAAIIFRRYIDVTDIYISITGALGLAIIYFLWRNHWAVFRIYKAQADKLEDYKRETSPKIFLEYVEKTCCSRSSPNIKI